MNSYINSFVRGRELLKKLLVGDIIAAILSAFTRSNPGVMAFFTFATVILFVAIIYVALKFCRCPKCGKRILLGVLAVESCPRCKSNLTTGKKMKRHR